MSTRAISDGFRFLLLGCALLILHNVIAGHLAIHPFVPAILIPFVIYLAVSTRIPLPVGICVAFCLGFLFDSFSGLPFGLYTLTHVATYVVSRAAGLRFFMRGVFSEITLAFIVCFLAGCLELAMRAIFEYPAPFPAEEYSNFVVLLCVSVSTAFCAPIIFFVLSLVERWSMRRQEQAKEYG
ncbi:MAG: rod shape-determining protein MreD [Myxococcales bacterium]|nr:MAG: rod shape-determining protein MreD [Myxococcales bacterium]